MPQSDPSPRNSRWTAILKARFIDCLEHSPNVSAAARACGLSRQAAYQLRDRDPAFARAWDAVQRSRYVDGDGGLAERLRLLDQAPKGSHEARFAELLRLVAGGGKGRQSFSRTL